MVPRDAANWNTKKAAACQRVDGGELMWHQGQTLRVGSERAGVPLPPAPMSLSKVEAVLTFFILKRMSLSIITLIK